MKHYLEKLGLQISEGKPVTAAELTNIMESIRGIHDQMMNDVILQPAAYGCAIGGLSLALDVSLRTAAMVFDEWNRLHPRKFDLNDQIQVVVIDEKEDNSSG